MSELKAIKQKSTARRDELQATKLDGKKWTADLQEELDEVVMFLVDLEEIIEGKHEPEYTPSEGTKDKVHLLIVRGRKFNPNTGEEESKPYPQIFSYPEWVLFKENFKSLGYHIEKVLFDPYGEAEAFVTK